MAWSWSHTNEAYAAAYNNVHKQDREWLEVCYAEWHATEMHDEESAMAGTLDINSFNEDKYNEALAACKNLPNDILADYIWERMSEEATCDNGGFNAWACPSGCHTVPFDLEEVETE